MKWFKHLSDASIDYKLEQVLLDYGYEGYGLYWHCLELISMRVDKHNLTFELEHDARILSRKGGISVQRVEEMMRKFIEIGLFESSEGRITCLRLAHLTDEYTAKLARQMMDSGQTPDKLRLNRREEKEEKKKKEEKNGGIGESYKCFIENSRGVL